MELQFKRVDLMQVAPLSRNTMVVLPPGKKPTLKIVSGDTSGVVTCFSMRKSEVNVKWRSLPFSSAVNRVSLGTVDPKDKPVIAYGTKIAVLQRKSGKQFFDAQTSMSEDIHHVVIEDNFVWTAGEYVFSSFEEDKEKLIDRDYFISSDKINDLICMNFTNNKNTVSNLTPILACQDRFIRALNGSELLHETPVEGPVMSLHSYEAAGSFDQAKQVLYGTNNGFVGSLFINGTETAKKWVLDKKTPQTRGGVQTIKSFDFTEDGIPDIIVGCDNGLLEVFSFDVNPDEPRQAYKTNIRESVSSVSHGPILHEEYHDVVISTFSGKIMAYTASPRELYDEDEEAGVSSSSSSSSSSGVGQTSGRITKVRKELDDLQKKLQKERAKYKEFSAEMITQSSFPIKDKFWLNPDDASYTFSVETQLPLDTVILQSNIAIDLLDVEDSGAIVTQSPIDLKNENLLLATFKCPEGDSVNRLEMRIRTIEGQQGMLTAYVIPRMSPKTCTMVQVPIKPLSLHTRILEPLDRPLNTARISGNFSVSEIHSWLSQCLPELPERPPSDEVTYYFKSTFLGSYLQCTYKINSGVFQSDSISTITILKEVISKEATARKTPVKFTIDINDDTVASFLELLWPKLEYQLTLAKTVRLVDALQEISQQETETQFLDSTLKEVLENGPQIRKEFAQQPRMLEFLYGIVTDLYIDKHKSKGKNVKGKVGELAQILDEGELELVTEFICK